MIDVRNLTKRYAAAMAVDGISFTVQKGEVVGFLGPNGAGKTTTLRVLTAYLPPTSGTALVDGFDVAADSLEVRRRIGYLPENVPLYPEMRVREYLAFRAALKEVPRKERKSRVADAMEKAQVGDVCDRVVGQLSKGYRQRVGLADALVANPPILVLDEPTVGLDPNQIRQTRDLIRALAKSHTILLSTHILSEVEATCSRVVIIHKGRIVGQGTAKELRAQRAGEARVLVEARGEAEAVARSVRGVAGVRSVSVQPVSDGPEGIVRLEAHGEPGRDQIGEDIFRAAVAGNWVIREIRTEQARLEDIFAELTTDEAEGGKAAEARAPATAEAGS